MLWRTFWGSKKFACTSLPHKFPLSNVHVWETIDNDTQFNIVWVGISRNSGITTKNRRIYPKSTFFNFLTLFWVRKHQKPPNPFDDIKYPPPISNIGGHPQHIPTHLAPIVGYHLGTHPNFIHKKHTKIHSKFTKVQKSWGRSNRMFSGSQTNMVLFVVIHLFLPISPQHNGT